jgi:hypothetical protein
VNSAHWKNWSATPRPRSGRTLGSARGFTVVPVKVAPPLVEVLTRMSLLQAPGTFTPV